MDLFFYVFGDSTENELMLLSVLNAFYESISMILRKNVEKRAVFDHMDRSVLSCPGGGVPWETWFNHFDRSVLSC